jgi:hypothetical protein
MTDNQWAELFRRVPWEAQNSLLLALRSGTNIAVQDFLRIDAGYLLVRGRVAGTSDAGQIFCIPYEQIMYCCVAQSLPEAQLREIFGDLLHPLVEAGPPPEVAQPAPAASEPAPLADLPPLTPPPLSPSSGESRGLSSLKERLRARLANPPDRRQPQ